MRSSETSTVGTAKPCRMIANKKVVHIADLRAEKAYHLVATQNAPPALAEARRLTTSGGGLRAWTTSEPGKRGHLQSGHASLLPRARDLQLVRTGGKDGCQSGHRPNGPPAPNARPSRSIITLSTAWWSCPTLCSTAFGGRSSRSRPAIPTHFRTKHDRAAAKRDRRRRRYRAGPFPLG
jgi:hypothetical protein